MSAELVGTFALTTVDESREELLAARLLRQLQITERGEAPLDFF